MHASGEMQKNDESGGGDAETSAPCLAAGRRRPVDGDAIAAISPSFRPCSVKASASACSSALQLCGGTALGWGWSVARSGHSHTYPTGVSFSGIPLHKVPSNLHPGSVVGWVQGIYG